MRPFQYLEAKNLKEACSLLHQYGQRARILAGGTDLLVAMKEGRERPEIVINLQTIPGLDQIALEGEMLRIGSLVTLAAVEGSPSIRDKARMLVQTARQMANPGIRNMATVGGNLCNAAPSADMAPPLIALGAVATVVGVGAQRTIPIEEFFLGPGKSALERGEILACIHVPCLSPRTTGTAYIKMAARTSLGLALAGVGVVLKMEEKGNAIADARVVLGAVAPTPMRARRAEDVLSGKPLVQKLMEESAQQAAHESRPISDVRGSAEYRSEMVQVLTMRALLQAANRNQKRETYEASHPI